MSRVGRGLWHQGRVSMGGLSTPRISACKSSDCTLRQSCTGPPLKHERSRRKGLGEDTSPHMCEVPTQDRSFGFGLANDPR